MGFLCFLFFAIVDNTTDLYQIQYNQTCKRLSFNLFKLCFDLPKIKSSHPILNFQFSTSAHKALNEITNRDQRGEILFEANVFAVCCGENNYNSTSFYNINNKCMYTKYPASIKTRLNGVRVV